jgi:hypothetical protein
VFCGSRQGEPEALKLYRAWIVNFFHAGEELTNKAAPAERAPARGYSNAENLTRHRTYQSEMKASLMKTASFAASFV